MEINRNQYFLLGLVMLFIGIQFRMVDSFVANEKASRFIAERFHAAGIDSNGGGSTFLASAGPTPRRTLRPPTWLGWACMSIGAVLILHSMAMKRPGT